MNILAIALAVVALAVLVFLLLIALLRQRSGSQRPLRVSHMPQTHAIAPVLCPKCHALMQNGFTTAERGIAWCDGDTKIPGRMSLAWMKAVLPNTVNHGFALRLNTAWRCGQCSIIVIDYSSLNKPPGDRL